MLQILYTNVFCPPSLYYFLNNNLGEGEKFTTNRSCKHVHSTVATVMDCGLVYGLSKDSEWLFQPHNFKSIPCS